MKYKILFFFILITQQIFAQDSLIIEINYFNIYNKDIAKDDIVKGKVQLIQPVIKFGKWDKKMEYKYDSITMKYGFVYKYIQDINHGHFEDAVNEYNAVVKEYLFDKNGEGWMAKMQADFDSLSPYKFPYRLYLHDKPSTYKISTKEIMTKSDSSELIIDEKDQKSKVPYVTINVMGNNLDTQYYDTSLFNIKPFKIKTNASYVRIRIAAVGFADLFIDSVKLKPNTSTHLTAFMEIHGMAAIAHIKCKCKLSDEEINQIIKEKSGGKDWKKIKLIKNKTCRFDNYEI